ncbi:MAG: DUF2064 domain-containing protein, partial [Pedobacter sp.]|nr:DUF2064 domain-containing protein [Pedobacter sp.]
MNCKNVNSNTCILYFTTGKTVEKSFSFKKRKSLGLQRVLFERTLNEIKKSKLAYQINDGTAFGADIFERLNGSIAQIFASGFQQVILLGDDTPELSAVHIKQAAKHLENGKVSIGPSNDGGVYLIAFSNADFNRGILHNLTWHGTSFCGELIQNLKRAEINFEVSKELEDLDRAIDLTVYLSKHLKNRLF